MMSMLGKYQGCLIGGAVGDAIGAPIETKTAAECQSYIEKNIRPMDFTKVQREGPLEEPGPFPFGQYTDDTQLSRELTESIISNGGFSPESFRDRLISLFSRGLTVGAGSSTKAAVANHQAGLRWMWCGLEVATNGGAMRAAPIGLLYPLLDQRGSLISEAKRQGKLTHRHVKSDAACIVVAACVSAAIRGENPRSKAWWIKVQALARPYDAALAADIGKLWGKRHKPLAELASWVTSIGAEEAGVLWQGGINPGTHCTILWSLLAFMRTPLDYWETICTAVWPGGDVDTTAAIAGAISGAYNGLTAIPGIVAQQINDKGAFGYHYLKDLAAQLHMTAGNI